MLGTSSSSDAHPQSVSFPTGPTGPTGLTGLTGPRREAALDLGTLNAERSAKPLLGAMQQHAKIRAVYAQAAAHLVLVALVHEQPMEQIPIFRRQIAEHFADPRADLFAHEHRLGVREVLRNILVLGRCERRQLRLTAVDLEQDVVADRVHERAEAFG